jgi:hypothetical protein
MELHTWASVNQTIPAIPILVVFIWLLPLWIGKAFWVSTGLPPCWSQRDGNGVVVGRSDIQVLIGGTDAVLPFDTTTWTYGSSCWSQSSEVDTNKLLNLERSASVWLPMHLVTSSVSNRATFSSFGARKTAQRHRQLCQW